MGYSVYEDFYAATWGVERWAGYAVPGTCDAPDCEEVINRGMSHQCEPEEEMTLGEHRGLDCMGCGMFFCKDHRFGIHRSCVPKPDSLQWEAHILSDTSWAEWRRQNRKKVREMKKRQKS